MKRNKDHSNFIKIISLSVFSLFFSIIFISHYDYIKSFAVKKLVFMGDIYDGVGFYRDESKVKRVETSNLKVSSYILFDTKNATSVLEYNSNEKYPLASLTKLMTTYVALSDCGYGDREKIKHMLVISSNEDADSIADECGGETSFVNKMNSSAKELGLNMTFENPSGLDKASDTVATAFGDSYSVAKLITLISREYPDVLEATTHNYYDGTPNTNYFTDVWPFLIGSKTGFTDVAGGNLATIFSTSPDKNIVIVVLGSTREGRFEDVYKLLKAYIEK